jgi:hypothetical protein
LTPELNFATHMLDLAMTYSHKNYIVKNQHEVMYSRLLEDESLLTPYENELATKLVWIKKKGVPQHPVIRFESELAESEYLGWVRLRHESMLLSKFTTAEGVFIV